MDVGHDQRAGGFHHHVGGGGSQRFGDGRASFGGCEVVVPGIEDFLEGLILTLSAEAQGCATLVVGQPAQQPIQVQRVGAHLLGHDDAPGSFDNIRQFTIASPPFLRHPGSVGQVDGNQYGRVRPFRGLSQRE